jgi:dodecin
LSSNLTREIAVDRAAGRYADRPYEVTAPVPDRSRADAIWRTKRCALPSHPMTWRERSMSDHVYKVVELVGSSQESIEDAVRTAIKRADQTLRNLRWFEVVQTRGHVENGEVRHFQVVLKAGFTLEGEYP